MNQPATPPRPGQAGADPAGREGTVATEFFRDFLVFIFGILIGFFWHLYYTLDSTSEAHIIIGLVVIIICMGRYIFLYKSHMNRPEKDDA